MEMGERIRELRKSKGLTQEELAQKLGLKDSAIAKYENGRVENIKRSVIAQMAKIFECSPVYLLGLDEDSYTTQDFILSDEERELIIEYRNSDSASREMAKRILSYSKLIDKKS